MIKQAKIQELDINAAFAFAVKWSAAQNGERSLLIAKTKEKNLGAWLINGTHGPIHLGKIEKADSLHPSLQNEILFTTINDHMFHDHRIEYGLGRIIKEAEEKLALGQL